VRYAAHAPQDTIFSIKLLIGLDFHNDKVQEVRKRVAYDICPSTAPTDRGVYVSLNNQLRTPIDVSTMIMQQIKEDCTQALGQPIEGATITVPAYFQDCQRNATKEAGERMQLRLRPLLNLDQTGIPTPMDLGVEIFRDGNPHSFQAIVPKGTLYPMTEPRRKSFRPTVENQRLIRVPIFQGSSALTTLNSCQGVVEFGLPQGIPTNTPVEIGFLIDFHGNLTVEVSIPSHKIRREEAIKRNQPVLSQEQEEQLGRWKEELENGIAVAEHFLQKYGPFMTAEDRQHLTDLIAQGRKVLAGADRTAALPVQKAIHIALLGSSTASVLFLAQRAQELADERMAEQIARAKVALEKAYKDGNQPQVDKLSDALKLAVHKVFGAKSEEHREPLPGQLTE
jgi:molecular chaperone DnaK (HSP70)